jgi:hypothetical protein
MYSLMCTKQIKLTLVSKGKWHDAFRNKDRVKRHLKSCFETYQCIMFIITKITLIIVDHVNYEKQALKLLMLRLWTHIGQKISHI